MHRIQEFLLQSRPDIERTTLQASEPSIRKTEFRASLPREDDSGISVGQVEKRPRSCPSPSLVLPKEGKSSLSVWLCPGLHIEEAIVARLKKQTEVRKPSGIASVEKAPEQGGLFVC